jgi:hypothetical protein
MPGADVDNRQPSMRQSHRAVKKQTLAVRAAMPHHVPHRRQSALVDAITRIK